MKHVRKNEIKTTTKTKAKKKIKTRTIVIWAIVLLILTPIFVYGGRLVYKLYFDKAPTFVTSPVDDEQSPRPSDLPDPETSGIDNIVLFGVDNRSESDMGRTDSIIIATIDKSSQIVKLTSVMRDLYVEMGNGTSMNRMNAAYAFGGPELALKTLNKNFGLDLKYYAIIDFSGFQELVDDVGGIDLDVKDYEVQEINKYIKEVNGENSTLLKKGGFQHLNGQQALSYARIRHVGDGDFQRTERQRAVLKCLFEKAKGVNILQIPDLITTLASYVQTNMPLSRVVSLGVTAYRFTGGMEQMRLPVDGYFEGQNVNGNSVLVADIKANAMFVKEFIYNIKVPNGKDLPPYMQNNFHMDDNTTVASRPKPNIPDYRTPDPPKSEDEQESTEEVTQPGEDTGTEPGGDDGTQTGEDDGTQPGEDDGTEPGEDDGTQPGEDDGTQPGEDDGTQPDENDSDPVNSATP